MNHHSLLNHLDQQWRTLLNDEISKPYFADLLAFVALEYESSAVYPKQEDIFAAFNYCLFDQVKVVIIGQDPYHGKNQAHGLAFSVPNGITIPPSLKNIFKELKNDLGVLPNSGGSLISWAEQGVLLLNATLTVRENSAASHQKHGWEKFTDAVIRTISLQKTNVVYLLWGNSAIQKQSLINSEQNLILTSVHPSPLSASRGFFGNHHFSTTNHYLQSNSKTPIRWGAKPLEQAKLF